jgi:hypothetical protein
VHLVGFIREEEEMRDPTTTEDGIAEVGDPRTCCGAL